MFFMELSAVKATVIGVGFCKVAEEFTRPTVDAYNNTVPWRVAGGHGRPSGRIWAPYNSLHVQSTLALGDRFSAMIQILFQR